MYKSFITGWYVLYVKSYQEKKVAFILKENGLTVFLPLLKTIRKWSDRKKTIEVPLFPSYIFVKIDSAADFSKALSVDGACTYIRFGHEYAIVKENEINDIKLLIGAEDISDIKVSNEVINVGEIKKIYFGSLSGLECEILRVDDNRKVLVRIESLRQNITASLPSYYFSETSPIL